jgi:hypothetical protein
MPTDEIKVAEQVLGRAYAHFMQKHDSKAPFSPHDGAVLRTLAEYLTNVFDVQDRLIHQIEQLRQRVNRLENPGAGQAHDPHS